MADKIKIEGGCEVGYHIHEDDGWYGKNHFYYVKTNIEKKTEASKKYKSMVRKYIKHKYFDIYKKYSLGGFSCLKEGDEQTTYIHSVGPTYFLHRHKIDNEKLEEFIELETKRLKWNRENQYHKVNFEEYQKYMV